MADGPARRRRRRSGSEESVDALTPLAMEVHGDAGSRRAQEECRGRLDAIVLDPCNAQLGYEGVDICFVDPTEDMVAAEEALRLALVGQIGGDRPHVSPEDLGQAIRSEFEIAYGDFSVVPCHSFDFVIKFKSSEIMERVDSRGRVTGPNFFVLVRKWSRHDGSKGVELRVKAEVIMKGVPAHAWQERVVREFLAKYCWVETLYMDTAAPRQMVHVSADVWVSNLRQIPPKAFLAIPEPESGLKLTTFVLDIPAGGCKKFNGYPITIDVSEIRYLSPPVGVSPDRFGSDNGCDGVPTEPFDDDDRSYGGFQAIDETDSDREPAAWKPGYG
ncbi:hypothetical protein EJB05_53443 [Eragrostis curvula]|uniref:Uncharacterized protein n=1 Tax=Eragrostis curvula TaxID=38414 RepID=A0A5J9SQB6_9POAL|nr:hypothetical protein EJB05_53443 [Eragrostis curvula]